jgi:hypothetical protein
MSKKLPVSVLIMTQNEEKNIYFAIESVKDWFDQIIVTDSFSGDATKEICLHYGYIEFYENNFVSWSDQRNWMLENCKIRNDFIFFLDADEYIGNDFIDELRNLLATSKDFSAVYLNIKYIFLGKWLKHAYGHPKIKRIFNKDNLYFFGEGAREYAIIKEKKSITMKSPLVHHDRKSFSYWIIKHIHNADREVNIFSDTRNFDYLSHTACNNLSARLKIKLFIRKNIWNRLPPVLRPLLYFLYRYFLLLGFIDGKAGFYYCFNHALWYQYLISIRSIEARHE